MNHLKEVEKWVRNELIPYENRHGEKFTIETRLNEIVLRNVSTMNAFGATTLTKLCDICRSRPLSFIVWANAKGNIEIVIS